MCVIRGSFLPDRLSFERFTACFPHTGSADILGDHMAGHHAWLLFGGIYGAAMYAWLIPWDYEHLLKHVVVLELDNTQRPHVCEAQLHNFAHCTELRMVDVIMEHDEYNTRLMEQFEEFWGSDTADYQTAHLVLYTSATNRLLSTYRISSPPSYLPTGFLPSAAGSSPLPGLTPHRPHTPQGRDCDEGRAERLPTTPGAGHSESYFHTRCENTETASRCRADAETSSLPDPSTFITASVAGHAASYQEETPTGRDISPRDPSLPSLSLLIMWSRYAAARDSSEEPETDEQVDDGREARRESSHTDINAGEVIEGSEADEGLDLVQGVEYSDDEKADASVLSAEVENNGDEGTVVSVSTAAPGSVEDFNPQRRLTTKISATWEGRRQW
ncbi:hypothetical protein BU16DRAFT_532448 [Lophium mytilinum]|uniref:Uncharacterized protein n=1 Tax=Lophium mytilinum TaxID=390894 RepID=A0A6A6RE77_9PEZI|nr:hypothetical protein BU16DRAFT_532448 [Lophium mytilinum]